MASAPPNLTGLHGTAFSAAALRAWHTLAGEEPKIFRDDLALPLTGMSKAEAIALGERVPAASASTCVLRSRFTEDRLAEARQRLDQYVVLGAGLDSYAMRMGAGLEGLTVYEVDDPRSSNGSGSGSRSWDWSSRRSFASCPAISKRPRLPARWRLPGSMRMRPVSSRGWA